MRVRCILSLVLLAIGTVACSGSADPSSDPAELRDAVATGSPAVTAWATVLLAGTGIAIDPIYAPTGHAGETTPPRERLRAARDARLVVLQGAGFAKWARQAALPSSRTVRLIEKGDPGVLLVEERTHAHGAQGAHTHRGSDGHTWLDPKLAMRMASRLGDQLAAAFPEHSQSILLRRDAQFGHELPEDVLRPDGVHLAEVPRGLGVHGHGYGYLARAWGGEYSEVDVELDRRLTAAEWNRLRSQIDARGAILMLPRAPVVELEEQLREELKVICVVVAEGAEAAPAQQWLDERQQVHADLRTAIESLSERRE